MKNATYNKSLIDVWTPIHAGSGFFLGLGGVTPISFMALSLSFELFEQALEAKGEKGPETAVNVLGDLGIGLLTYLWGRHTRGKITQG